MQWLNIVVIGVALVVVSCDSDIQCTQRATGKCLQDTVESGTQGYCKAQKNFFTCFKRETASCKLDFGPVIQKQLDAFDKVCKEGTPLNQDLKDSGICLTSFLGGEFANNCLKKKEYKFPFNPTQEQILDVLKAMCKDMDNIESCTYGGAKRHCGDAGDRIVHALGKPAFEFQRLACTILTNARGARYSESEELSLDLLAASFFGPAINFDMY